MRSDPHTYEDPAIADVVRATLALVLAYMLLAVGWTASGMVILFFAFEKATAAGLADAETFVFWIGRLLKAKLWPLMQRILAAMIDRWRS